MLEWLKGAAFIILCLSTTFTVVTVGKHVSNTLMAMDESIAKLNTEIDEAHRLTLEAALTARTARKASEKELAMLDTWNTDINGLVLRTQLILASTSGLLDQTSASIGEITNAAVESSETVNRTVQALQSPIAQLNTDLSDLQPLIVHIDGVVNDQAIQATWTNVANTTAHLDATTADIQEQVHKWTHPGIWTKVKGFALDVAHVFNPL